MKHTRVMKTTKYIFALVIALSCAVGNLFAVDKSYYNSLNGKSGTALREALTNIVYTHHTTDLGYNWTFDGIDVVNGVVLDMYSSCTWSSNQQGLNVQNQICYTYNREHVVPQSLFDEVAPQKTDRHHLFLADGKVNGMRSSYPFGETNVTTAFSSLSNGDKAKGKLGASSSGFTGTVYEPDDEYKGDIARAIMYMAVRYATNNECRKYGGTTNSKPVTTWSNAMFSGSLSTNYGLSANAVAMYMKWHRDDPPSAKEIARNNGVEVKQGNRNPFVDLPDLAEYLWGTHKTDAVDLSSLELSTGGGAVATPYEIILNRNGATQTLTCTGTYTLPTAGEETAACEGWPFVGWTTSSSYNSTTAPTYTTQTTGATTLYAVYANTASSAPAKKAAAVNDVLWAEDWTGATTASSGSNSATPSANYGRGTTVYNNGTVTYAQSANTVYVRNESLAGGSTPELMLSSGKTWTISNIPTGEATELTLTYKSNNTKSSVTCSTEGTSISGSSTNYTITPGDNSNITLVFGCSGNTRIDDVSLTVATAGSGSGGGSTTYMTLPTCGDPHTITLSSGGTVIGGEFEASASSAYAGATITLTAEASAGYTFGSWTVTNNSTSATITVTDNQFTMPDANVTVSATFSALTTYNIRFYNNGTQIGTTQSIYSGGYPDIPSNPTACEDYTFVGWYTSILGTDNTESHTWVEDFTVSGAQDYYAVFSKTEGGSSSTIIDELTRATTDVSNGSTTYSNWSGKTGTSGAVYAGNSAGGNNSIQLRSSGSNSGIITTKSGGKATYVTVEWNSNTSDNRVIDIYGKNSAYSNASELYGSTTEQGTNIGSIPYDGTITSASFEIEGDYEFIGIRSLSGALYLNSISITWSSNGGSTTYYTTVPDCEACTNKVTLTKGTPSNGSFNLNKADGEYENCKAGGLVVTVSDITPAEDYQFSAITQTGIASGVTIDQDAKTVTYAKDVTGSSTINVLFEHKPTYTICFYDGTTLLKQETVTQGKSATAPANPAGCDGYTFVGWWTSALATDNTTAETWITSFTATQNQDYYAVYSHTVTSAGGGTPTVLLSEGFDDEQNADLGEAIKASTFSNFSGETSKAFKGHGGLKFGSSSAFGYVTTKSLDLSSAFTVSLGVMRYGSDNTTVYVQVAGDDDTKKEIATSSLSTSEYTTSELSFDAATDASAIKIGTSGSGKRAYIDNVVITSGGGGSSTTYYTSTTTCTPPCEGDLDKPTVTATPGNGKITLTWPDVTNADHYTVTIGQGAGYTTECGSAASIGTITNLAGINTCVITGLTNGLEYTTNVVANGTTICDSPADEDQATPMDCTPWDDPTLTYDSYALTVGSAHATLTISGTQHGTPTFSSSNMSVLTVDAAGEVTPVGAGTATITAHWEMTDDYCEKDVVSSPFTVSGPLTITFNANDGTDEPATKTQTVTYNVAANLDANTFTRTGYVFQGWATTADGGVVHNDGASVTFTESTVLYAVWQINSHNVTFTPSITGATVTVNSQSTSPQSAEFGSTVTVAVTPAAHYTLYSIEVSNGASVTIKNNTGTFTMPDEDVTVTVTMTEESQYTASFMNCGVAYSVAQTGYAGTSISAPAGTPEACEGYTFVGWVTSEQTAEATSHSETVTFPQSMPSSDITYHALYRRIEGGSGSTNVVLNTSAQYTNGQEADSKEVDGVTFAFAIGGNSSNAPKYYSSGTSVRMYSDNTLTISSAFTITDIEFVWGDQHNAGLDASVGEYNANNTGGSWSGSTTSVTFTAGSSGQQRITSITVTIDGGGTPYYTTAPTCTGYIITVAEVSQGEGASDKKRCDEGGTVTITLTPNEGYECGGITTSPAVTPTGSGCTYTFTMPASDITVTPVFTPKTPRTFTFVPGSGTCATTELSEGVWNTGVTLPTATANSGCEPEYVFAGWATAFVSETDVRPTLYKAGENYNGEDLTLYAVYAQTTAGSSAGFTLSYTKDDVTYYATGRTGTNKYLDASTDVAEAARFSVVTSNDKQFLCWHGTEDTYIYTGTSTTSTNLSFTTNIASAANGWDVTETDATLKLQSNGNDRYFMFNTNQKDRFAAYAVEGELTKGDAGTTIYNSAPSCICSSVDITYNANGGTLAAGCGNVTGGDCELDWKLCDAPTRDGYLFSGWKDLSGNLYEAGATISDLKISLTLTAQWIPAPYTVLFDAGTGTCIESLTEASRGDGITLPKAEPSAACADDWTFIGWSETKITGEASTATIIGVSGITYLPAADNTTLYAVYRRVDTDAATNDYTRVTSTTPAEGDYVIVVARSEESFGKLAYGTLNKGRLTFTKDYTELPTKITSPAATEIWHFTYDAEGYAYLYNVNAGAYLAASGYNVTYDAYAGSAFVFTRDPGTYGDFQCLNNTASSSDNYYLGANKEYDLIRYYGSSNIVSLYSVTLYQGSAGTRYYSTEPQCTECEDPEWSFELGTSVVKSKGSAPFTNTVIKGHESAGTVTYSSTNEAVATVDNTGLVTLVGTGTTTITLRLTRAMPYCAAVLQYELEVKEPSIDIVGVTAGGEIIVEHDLEGTITLNLSEGQAISTGTAANDIFFSKYFEAASNMKLFAIFNGTGHEVDLSHIRVRCNCTTAGTGVWPTKTGDLGYVELSNVSKLREQYPKMKIPSGTELVFWSNNKGNNYSTQTYNTYLRNCIEIKIGDMTYSYSDMEAGEIPDWFCLGSYTDYNTKDADGNNQFVFNGDDSMIMERYDEATGTWVAIDLFGAGTSEAPAPTTGLVEQITDEYEINGETQALNDGTGFHAECAGNPIPLSTNRYMLIRKNSVLDGLAAVASNTTSFATLCSEWNGTPVGGDKGADADNYCNSGEKFSDIGEYPYAENYIDWDGITGDEYTITENTDGTVTITFKDDPKNLDARACDLLKVEVHDETDPTQVLATTEYKIPIVVKEGDVMTTAELFSNQGDKCATCDVAILGSATLTKATDGETNDMPTVRDIYVYGGGKLIIPEGTHYNAHDLILRTQVADDKINMNVPNIQVSGSLVNQYGGSIRQQTRVGTTRFYQFAVPYVVRLEDVTFTDGTPAVYGEDFMIRYYDGEQRAVNLGTVSNWRNYEGTELYPGVGYTLAVAKKTGHTYRELVFPMDASLAEGEPATKETTIHAWGDNTIRANHRGWNFLSNPYLTTYGQNHLDDAAEGMLTTGQLVPDPEHPGWWVSDEGTVPYVTLINSTRTDYSQELVSLQELPPFTTFFIQAGDDTHSNGAEFSLTFNRNHRKNAPSYIRAEQKQPVARFGVLLSGNNAQDNCGMVIGENYSAAYDMQADLSKEFGSAYSLKLYTLQEDQMRLAFQAIHPDSLHKVVPVGIRLPAAAEYTFSIDRRYNLGAFRHIYLIDNVIGQHTDLLTDTYSFTSTKQQNDARFCLNIVLQRETPTDIHNLLNGIYVAGSTHSFLLSGLPMEAEIYVYDMSGHLVSTQHTTGVSSAAFSVPSGVYQIRVMTEGANALLRTIVH